MTTLPLDWAFGAGEHAVTFVSKVSRDFYLEHSFSYYPAITSFDLTPRHDALHSGTLNEAMGQPIRTRGPGPAITNCFQCHSTGPVTVSPDGDIQPAESGVRCESCHGPGGAHRAAALAGNVDSARKLIGKLNGLSGPDVNRFCGKCHRSTDTELDWNSPWSVRHQPPYLARSRCFESSAGKLTCLTCHRPHERVRRDDPAFYRARCTACHSSGSHVQEASACVNCHMPPVSFGAHMTFSNHWIGVYKPGDVLKPRGARTLVCRVDTPVDARWDTTLSCDAMNSE